MKASLQFVSASGYLIWEPGQVCAAAQLFGRPSGTRPYAAVLGLYSAASILPIFRIPMSRGTGQKKIGVWPDLSTIDCWDVPDPVGKQASYQDVTNVTMNVTDDLRKQDTVVSYLSN